MVVPKIATMVVAALFGEIGMQADQAQRRSRAQSSWSMNISAT